EVVLSRLDPSYAGGLLDDYYGYRYPDTYDGRYSDYDAYLSDPYYYDPYRRYASYRYVPEAIPGAWELDAYGDWRQLSGYGYAWSPRVADGWAPYREGRWVMDDPYGLTWVSSEPWGYAPYHYGRWVSVNNQWYWVPEGAGSRPAYSPALVAFLPLSEAGQVGWVPLAPGDPYVSTYYDAEWRPHYVGEYVEPERVVNFGVPGAVTVVPAEYFGREIDRRVVVEPGERAFKGARPVLDPLSVAMLRQAALTRAVERRGFVLPPGLAKRLEETRVYAGAEPPARPFKAGRAARVERVTEKQKGEKLKIKDERRAEVARQPRELPTSGRGRREVTQQQADDSRGVAREEKEARRAEGRPVRQSPARPEAGPPQHAGRGRGAVEKPVRAPERHAQGERVGMRPQHQPQAARPQAQRQQGPPQRQPKAERGQGQPGGGGGAHPQKGQGKPGKGKGKP
ncbi:MAG TPA: DUF6600 domain-containing protein, partial [Pyrinomonadaceae bacterium]|nr:DUF6600 domain-containing protein [Pyrinomonadaceae bacterium]